MPWLNANISMIFYSSSLLGPSALVGTWKKVGILLLFCLTLIRAICSAHLAKVGDDTFYEAIRMMMCLSKQQQKSLWKCCHECYCQMGLLILRNSCFLIFNNYKPITHKNQVKIKLYNDNIKKQTVWYVF